MGDISIAPKVYYVDLGHREFIMEFPEGRTTTYVDFKAEALLVNSTQSLKKVHQFEGALPF